jgi:hypothetical protein
MKRPGGAVSMTGLNTSDWAAANHCPKDGSSDETPDGRGPSRLYGRRR